MKFKLQFIENDKENEKKKTANSPTYIKFSFQFCYSVLK